MAEQRSGARITVRTSPAGANAAGDVADLERQLDHLSRELAHHRLVLSAARTVIQSERSRAEQAEARVQRLQEQAIVCFQRWQDQRERADRLAASLRVVQRCWWWRAALWLGWWA